MIMVHAATETIERMLRAATPWILRAELQPCPGGFRARVTLDPNMARARADQQGLADPSLPTAAANATVRANLAGYVARVNAKLPDGSRIMAHEIALR